jgi:hypothetical protein
LDHQHCKIMRREFPRGKRDFPNYVCSSDFNVWDVFLLGLGRVKR